MGKTLGTIVFVLILAAFCYPFVRDAYHRYEVGQRLEAVMDPNERAAFQQWNGNPEEFARRLFERCELSAGPAAAACQRYRYALE